MKDKLNDELKGVSVGFCIVCKHDTMQKEYYDEIVPVPNKPDNYITEAHRCLTCGTLFKERDVLISDWLEQRVGKVV